MLVGDLHLHVDDGAAVEQYFDVKEEALELFLETL